MEWILTCCCGTFAIDTTWLSLAPLLSFALQLHPSWRASSVLSSCWASSPCVWPSCALSSTWEPWTPSWSPWQTETSTQVLRKHIAAETVYVRLFMLNIWPQRFSCFALPFLPALCLRPNSPLSAAFCSACLLLTHSFIFPFPALYLFCHAASCCCCSGKDASR